MVSHLEIGIRILKETSIYTATCSVSHISPIGRSPPYDSFFIDSLLHNALHILSIANLQFSRLQNRYNHVQNKKIQQKSAYNSDLEIFFSYSQHLNSLTFLQMCNQCRNLKRQELKKDMCEKKTKKENVSEIGTSFTDVLKELKGNGRCQYVG